MKAKKMGKVLHMDKEDLADMKAGKYSVAEENAEEKKKMKVKPLSHKPTRTY